MICFAKIVHITFHMRQILFSIFISCYKYAQLRHQGFNQCDPFQARITFCYSARSFFPHKIMCFFLYSARLIVPLTCRPKVLSLGSAKKNEFFFCISLA